MFNVLLFELLVVLVCSVGIDQPAPFNYSSAALPVHCQCTNMLHVRALLQD